MDSTATRYQLGAPIELAEFLALPPTELRYGRDAQGRLVLMPPDDPRRHRYPLGVLVEILGGARPQGYRVLPEPGIQFESIFDLEGRRIRDSFLGPKRLMPDVAVLKGKPAYRETWFDPRPFRLAIEILSPGTWRSDLGIAGRGRKDDVDRMRSYLESGLPEYWILNPALERRGCPIPPRGARFLSRRKGGSAWEEIPAESGVVHSRAVPGLAFDVDAFWNELE